MRVGCRAAGRQPYRLTAVSTTSGVAHPMNVVVRDHVEDKIRIRLDNDAPQAAPTCYSAGHRMQCDKVDNCLDARLDICGLWRALIDVRENLIEFLGGPTRIAEPHRPCFAQIALISSSVANSPRSASVKDASKEASSTA